MLPLTIILIVVVSLTSAATAEAKLANPPSHTGLPPHLRNLVEKHYLVDLINRERQKAGVPPVVLGNNDAAQMHADSALDNCFPSHWGIDGLKPYMRYSLAGGYQSNGENGIGGGSCVTASDGYASLRSVKYGLDKAMTALVGSPGHYRAMVNKHRRKVSLGIAYDRYNLVLIQHFEGDYVEYDDMPTISDGILAFSGNATNGVTFNAARDLQVWIYYDPPPHELTREDVAETSAYCFGLKVASILVPPRPGHSYTVTEFDANYEPCPGDPYDTSYENVIGDYIIAENWLVEGTSFEVSADISTVLEKYGPGVYTVMVWGWLDGEQLVISTYSLFHMTETPNRYSIWHFIPLQCSRNTCQSVIVED